MADRAQLVNLRRESRGGATRHITKLNQIPADAAIPNPRKIFELRQRLNDLIAVFTRMEDLDQQIYNETADQADLDAEMDATEIVNDAIRTARDNVLFQIIALEKIEADAQAAADAAARAAINPPILPQVPQNPPILPQLPPNNPNPVTRSSTRPKIPLPRFDGEVLKWQPFWQAFDAEIHSDPTIANINKFNYLMGQLEPCVSSTVGGLFPSNDSYPQLVNLLQERYGSVPKIIMAYMRALYALPIPENSISSLRTFYDSLESYVRGLEALGKAADTYGDLLVCILLDKLPGDLRQNLARRHDQDDWPLEDLRKALRDEIRVLEAGQSSSSSSGSTFKQTNAFYGTASSASKTHAKCSFCDGEHFPSHCSQFETPESRMNIAIQKRLCQNCLSRFHLKKDCKSSTRCHVPGCKQSHHTSLHGSRNNE